MKFKSSSIIFLLLAFTFTLTAKAPKGWIPGPDDSWKIVYKDALAAAKKSDKNILVLSTGSDWCGFCVKLRKDVFDKKEFQKYAKKNLILLWLDMPKNIQQPQAQKEHNSKTRSDLKFPGGVPCMIILSPDGERLRTQVGYAPWEKTMKFIRGTNSKSSDQGKKKEKVGKTKEKDKDKADEADEADKKDGEDGEDGEDGDGDADQAEFHFKLISYGINPKKLKKMPDTSKPLIVKPGTKVYFKIKYDIPRDNAGTIFARPEEKTVTGAAIPPLITVEKVLQQDFISQHRKRSTVKC